MSQSHVVDRLVSIHDALAPAHLSAEQQGIVFDVALDLFFGSLGEEVDHVLSENVCSFLFELGQGQSNVSTDERQRVDAPGLFNFLCCCLTRNAKTQPQILLHFFEKTAKPLLLDNATTQYDHLIFAALESVLKTCLSAESSPAMVECAKQLSVTVATELEGGSASNPHFILVYAKLTAIVLKHSNKYLEKTGQSAEDLERLGLFARDHFLEFLQRATLGLEKKSQISSRCQFIFLVELLPALLDMFRTDFAFDLWSQTHPSDTGPSTETKLPLSLMCLLAGALGEKTEGSRCPLFATCDMWMLIHSALASGDTSLAKIGVTLLEHCVASLNRQLDITITGGLKASDQSASTQTVSTKERRQMEKEQRDVAKRWEIFVDMFETTDQFAIHMVEPVWNQLLKKCTTNGKSRGKKGRQQSGHGPKVNLKEREQTRPLTWFSPLDDLMDGADILSRIRFCLRGHALPTIGLIVRKLVAHHNPRVRANMIKRLLASKARPVWSELVKTSGLLASGSGLSSVESQGDVVCDAVVPALCDYSLYSGGSGKAFSESVVSFLTSYVLALETFDQERPAGVVASTPSLRNAFLSRLLFQIADQSSSPGIRTLLRVFSGEDRLSIPNDGRPLPFNAQHLESLSSALSSNFLNVPRSVREPVYDGLLDIWLQYTSNEPVETASAGTQELVRALRKFLSHFDVGKYLLGRSPRISVWVSESPLLHSAVCSHLNDSLGIFSSNASNAPQQNGTFAARVPPGAPDAILLWVLCGVAAQAVERGQATSLVRSQVPHISAWVGTLAGLHSRPYMSAERSQHSVEFLAMILATHAACNTAIASADETEASGPLLQHQDVFSQLVLEIISGSEPEILSYLQSRISQDSETSAEANDVPAPDTVDSTQRSTSYWLTVLVQFARFTSANSSATIFASVQSTCSALVTKFARHFNDGPTVPSLDVLRRAAWPCAILLPHCGSSLSGPQIDTLREKMVTAVTKCNIDDLATSVRRAFYVEKWKLLHAILSATSVTAVHSVSRTEGDSTGLSSTTLDSVLVQLDDAIPTAAVARDFIPQLKCLAQLLPTAVNRAISHGASADNSETESSLALLSSILSGCWSAFVDLSRSDQMTSSVVQCLIEVLFHPAIFCYDNEVLIDMTKKHIRTILGYSQRTQRKTIVQMMATRLCHGWTFLLFAHPAVPNRLDRLQPFVADIVELCLFSEFNPDSNQPLEAHIQPADYTRVIVLSWLHGLLSVHDVLPARSDKQLSAGWGNFLSRHAGVSHPSTSSKSSTDSQSRKGALEKELEKSNCQQFAQELVVHLLSKNFTDGAEQYMPESSEQREKCRIWQAIGILTPALPKTCINHEIPEKCIGRGVLRCLDQMHQPQVRYLIEMVSAALATRFPDKFFKHLVLPALRNYDQPPQCAMSYLIVATCVVSLLTKGDPQDSQIALMQEVGEELSISIATWLGAPDGLARTIAQYAMFAVVTAIGQPPNAYVQEQMTFLTDNRKCAKMREKQQRIFTGLDPLQECTIDALLARATGYDQEFQTGSLLDQIRETMEAMFAYFTDLDGPMGSAHGRALLQKATKLNELNKVEKLLEVASTESDVDITTDSYVQRKVLPWKMHELIGAAELQKELLVAKGKRSRVQEFIMCASLVDKVGLFCWDSANVQMLTFYRRGSVCMPDPKPSWVCTNLRNICSYGISDSR